MSLEVIQGVANNLVPAVGVARIYVIDCGVEWVTSTATFDRGPLVPFKDHLCLGEGASDLLPDQEFA
jgi:hypothetical protein